MTQGFKWEMTPEEVWRRYDRMEARLTAPLSERMLDLAGVGPGMRVLDLATGRGEPAIRAAHRVAPGGSVLGIDVSAGMLAMARERAVEEGVENLELRVMDAAGLEGIAPPSFQAALVRWGLMYMTAPVEALARARDALVPGAPLVAAVFVEPERCSYVSLPRRVLARHRSLSPIDPDSPGTFRYADPARLEGDLARAGLTLVHQEELEIPVMEAKTRPELVAWVRAFGMTPLLEGLSDDVQRSWEEELAREAEALRAEDGFIRLGGVTRIVVARERPA